MNIILIDPDMKVHGGNVGLGYLASVLLEKGHRVHGIGTDKKIDEINEKIDDMDANIIGFSVRSDDTKKIVELAAGIQKKKEALLICGGSHITLNGHSFLEENSCFDLGVVFEGEETILDIVDLAKGEKDLRDIKGIIGRDNGGIFQTEKREFFKDLDTLPFPNYSVFDIYADGMVSYGCITSRGCPFGCTYCNGPTVMGKRWRYRSVDNVIEELVQVKKSYKYKWIDIFDDNFTLNLKRAKEICQALIDNKLNSRWRLPNGIRADRVDDELAALMKQSGCKVVRVGIESGDADVFASINKGETLADIENGIRLLRRHGIKVVGSFIVGLPNSSYHKDMVSVKFAQKLKLDIAWFHIFCPLKNTKAYDMTYQQKGIRILRTENAIPIQYYSGKPYSVFDTEGYPEEDRIKVFMKGNLRFNDYLFTRNFSKSKYSLERLIILTKMIILYDAVFIPIHIIRLTRKFSISLGRSFYERVRNLIRAC